MSAAKINSSLSEEGYHYTANDLQDRLATALREAPVTICERDTDRITIKIPSGSEMTWSRATVEAALAETDPFFGL